MLRLPDKVGAVGVILMVLILGMVETAWALGEVHTSAVTVAQLVEAENSVTHALQEYVKKEETRLGTIKQYIRSWQGGLVDYVHNPINSFHLLRRVTKEYHAVQESLHDTFAEAVLANLRVLRESVQLPVEADLNGAAYALVRLQHIYNLSIDDLIDGHIRNKKAIQMLSADDCLRMAQQSFNNLEFELSEKWYQKVVELLMAEQPLTHHVHLMIDKLVKQKEHRVMLRTLVTQMAKDSDDTVLDQFSGLGIPTSFQKQIYEDHDQEYVQLEKLDHLYSGLCRGDVTQPPEAYAGLKCGYAYSHDYRRLMPFKVELRWADPIIVVYHDVLSEAEISTVKHIASPRLETTMVHSFTTHQMQKSLARVGKTAWVQRGDDTTVDRILQRIEDMTGLTTDTSEDFHVLNYGIGGHYDAHVDFFDLQNKSLDKAPHLGDRLATMLFYLNDVEAGGSTVFPTLAVEVPARQGSALFWFNLERNGKGDYRTMHAACPVLLGEKWIANLWLHEFGQEFRWPCTLDPKD